VSFLEGRTAPVKHEIGRRLLRHLREYYATANEISALQISVEIKDIQRPLYFKFPELV
jgi:5-carboxymethyl-2-hydroxymuconate isomerase